MKVYYKNSSLVFQTVPQWQNIPFIISSGYITSIGDRNTTANAHNTGLVEIANYTEVEYLCGISEAACDVAFYSDGVVYDDTTSMRSHFLSSVSVVGAHKTSASTLNLAAAKAAGAKYVIFSCYKSGGTVGSYYAKAR